AQTPISEPVFEAPMPAENDAADTVQPDVEETLPMPVQSGEVPEADWPTILADASTALAAAKTARGDFIQANSDGSVVTGTFALNRPGRMRFDYDDPTPVLIVSDGTTVAMEDSELETVDRVPIGSTPLGLLLSSRLNVEEDVDVLGILQRGDDLGIRVQDTSGELDGTLTMVFDKSSYALKGWITLDGNDQTTVVDLVDVETNVRVDPRLFRINEDDDEDDER
ncbi:MAG: outer-membrane lipoprotein carrier protein LolA, partial [Pseudomonadota bacterium]